MSINPLGASPKTLSTTTIGQGAETPTKEEKQVVSEQPGRSTAYPRRSKFDKQVSVLTLVQNPGEEDERLASIEETLDGSFRMQALLGKELRPFNLRHPQDLKDPLEKRLQETVNSIFQQRKLMDSRKIVEDYGLNSGESFSLHLWDHQCDIPATCCSTFVCRWLCCCCSKCVTHTTPYEKLDKHLIRKECTTSYKECVDLFSVYTPSWFVRLFLQMQNARWNEETRFSTEDMLELKQEFFNDPSIPWIGIPPLMTAVNSMRMLTEVFSILHDPLRKKPAWTQCKLYQPSRNSVEHISKCKFLGLELSLELIAEILLVIPTGNEDFSGQGTMRRIYNILCSNIAIHSDPSPCSDLDPELVLGLLLRILEKLGVPFTPSESLKVLAYDCNVFENVYSLSFETQTRILALVRKALNSRYEFWYDRFNSTKRQEVSEDELMPSERGCSGCCTGCSSCCKPKEDEMDGTEMEIITQQPGGASNSLRRSMLTLSSSARPSPSPVRHGIGYQLMSTAGFNSGNRGLGIPQDFVDDDDFLIDD